MAEPAVTDKSSDKSSDRPSRAFARPLRELLGKVVGDTFTRQGFASAELVTRWTEIAGAEIAAHSEPVKIQWPRADATSARPPGTLVLRVEGPAAVEIQHLTNLICERVNRFLGWRAVERIALRQAPLRRREHKRGRDIDPLTTARIAATLDDVADEDLKQALARLGANVKRG
jgi:hypothetical protein